LHTQVMRNAWLEVRRNHVENALIEHWIDLHEHNGG